MESSVKVLNLGKSYNIDKNNFLPQFRRKDQNILQDKKAVAALNNVSFEIFKGDRLGVLGKNGAGKSTLLKIISKVTTPTLGQVEINGVVSSVLEFGAGFHQDLTGLENIYLSGAILGMSRKEINAKIRDIIEFSELKNFINTRVSKYSSGMIIKLGFAISAFLSSDIIILDEVLSVADENFRIKCINKILNDINIDSRTLIFVSHQIDNIIKLCNKVLVLNNGTVSFFGTTKSGVDFYNKSIVKC
jgi:lipopolysaccharide transport system ATP-binding protein